MSTPEKDYDHWMCYHAKNNIQDADSMVHAAEVRIKELTGHERISDILEMYRAKRDWYKFIQKLCDRIIRKHCHDEEVSTNPDSQSAAANYGQDTVTPEPREALA